MAHPVYQWPLRDEFLDREAEISRLDRWLNSHERMPASVYGRRRVGKSWLLRRFSHERPAVILVAERLAAGAQLTRFAEQLAPFNAGVTPDLPDAAAVIRTLYRLGLSEPLLAVIDEFPWLLGTTEGEAERALSSIQAVMEEERDASRTRLIVCGSAVGQMEALQSERSPMHGRLIALEVRPLDLERATMFFPSLGPIEAFRRFAISGGMPRYLAAFAGPILADAVCDQLLQPDAPLWNEGRTIVGQELREPSIHFAALEQLSSGEKEIGEIANALRIDSSIVSKYLATLESLRLVRRDLPFGASPSARGGHWVLSDSFLRFWFRFVFPFQADLEAGLDPRDLYHTEIEPALSDHVSPVFEEACRQHARATFGQYATRVGRWWGNARNDLRRLGLRSTEEIDLVGMSRGRVSLIGEAKWTGSPIDVSVLRDLQEYKIPALKQAGFKVIAQPMTVLYGRSEYTDGLRRRAKEDERLILIDVADMLRVRR